MIGIIIQLLLSWLLLWLFQKKNLSVLGFTPTQKRILDFILFFIITAAFCASGYLMRTYLGNEKRVINPELNFRLVLDGLWWNIKSVMFEELIFRGALLYILLQRIKTTAAIIISAVAFGIYHWFSLGVLGNPFGMMIVFISTGLMGMVLAYGFKKTNSLYVPIAIHLGWNFTNLFVFSQGLIGNGIFIRTVEGGFRTDSYAVFILVTFFPIISALLINFLILRSKKQA